MSKPLYPPLKQQEEPIDEDTPDEWDEDRIDNIGQNGNNGEHYDNG